MAADPRRTLGDYTIPSTASCGSSIVRPNVEANKNNSMEMHKKIRIYTLLGQGKAMAKLSTPRKHNNIGGLSEQVPIKVLPTSEIG
ncbi:hypothetical protein PIB30_081629 [Stylosanthes scabra]|uniref:Uncharacterized protein n=1 Tax=Stylosanthes scabra TaxID=79078 RepID=A0ABU6YQT0_9FABA|nr:hypothetical protein [Stylosanthes scabra]